MFLYLTLLNNVSINLQQTTKAQAFSDDFFAGDKGLERQSQQKPSTFVVRQNILEASMTNSMEQSYLGPRCLLLYF